MPPKGSSHGKSIAQTAQFKRLASAKFAVELTSESGPAVENGSSTESMATVQDLQQKIVALEAALLEQKSLSEQLSQALSEEQEASKDFLQALDTQREHSNKLLDDYNAQREHSSRLAKSLKVERRARQRGLAQKALLKEQIMLLQSECKEVTKNFKTVTRNADKTIEKILRVERENSNLQDKLSKALKHCSQEVTKAQEKLEQAGEKMQQHQWIAENLKKRFQRAASSQEKIMQRARDQVKKEIGAKLLYKGVYTEQTRSLIRILVQAGCSQAHVGKVIHAVFGAAGISVHGKFSRETVSRVIKEGFIAAQIQLGYEMEKAKRKFFLLSSFACLKIL